MSRRAHSPRKGRGPRQSRNFFFSHTRYGLQTPRHMSNRALRASSPGKRRARSSARTAAVNIPAQDSSYQPGAARRRRSQSPRSSVKLTRTASQRREEMIKTAKSRPVAFEAVFDFKALPLHLREGPWSPMAALTLTVICMSLAYKATDAIDSFAKLAHAAQPGVVSVNTRLASGTCALYMAIVATVMARRFGAGVFVSYTMLSWDLILVCHACRAIDHAYSLAMADFLLFPALVSNTVTVIVWWAVLAPLILIFLAHKDFKDAKNFAKFNVSFLLLNVHGLNFGAALWYEWLYSRQLCFWDLWVSLVFGIAYLVFYLAALDRNGYHFYIILSPRPHWCAIVYVSFLLLYAAIWRYWPLGLLASHPKVI